jgi:tetratricopeptide (TPR) repeat protein
VADRPRKASLPPAGSNSLYERYKDALRRGHVAALRGRNEAAIGAYSEAAAIATDRALPHVAIGNLLVKMGRTDDALASFERALRLAPRDEQALHGRGELLAAAGRRVEAADMLDRLALVLDSSGRLPEATDAARRALELAESRERRRQVEVYADRLRESAGDEAAARALAQVLRVLEPPVAAAAAVVVEEASVEPAAATEPEAEAAPEPEPEPEPEEELPDAFALGRAAEDALAAGDAEAAREGLLAAAAAHRRAGRSFAAIDACYLALAIAPADVDLHVLLTHLYLERGWRGPAVDKLVLLGRLADLADDAATRERLCAIATDELADEPRLAELCA